MGNRIALLASVLFAGIALTATSLSAAPADDECLAKPKGVAPAGKHWYYNTNRSTQRKCWYLDDAGEKTVAATPRKQPAPAPASNADSNRPISMQPPAADARAEFVEPRTEQRTAPVASLQAFTMPVPPSLAPATPVVPSQTEASQAAADSATQRNLTVASRWPDPAETFASQRPATVSDAAPAPRADNPSPVATPMPAQDESAAVVENSGDMSVVPIAAAIFLVVVCGAIVMFFASRRRSSDQHRDMHATERRREVRSRVAGASATVDTPEHIRLRDEIEQLLEVGRQTRKA
jgi:hypothetical protein